MRAFSPRSRRVFRLPVELLILLLLASPLMLLFGTAAGRGAAPTLPFWLLWLVPLAGLAWLLTCCDPEETSNGYRAAADHVPLGVRGEPIKNAIGASVEPRRSYVDHGIQAVEGVPQVRRSLLFRELERRLAPYGATPLIEDIGDGAVRVIALPMGVDERLRTRPSLLVNVLLLAVTLLTTTYVGAQQQGVDPFAQPDRFAAGLPYALTLLSILGIHELGHYVMGRHHGVEVTPPYFIPVPFGLGTFGAFIQIKSLVKTRRAVFDIGIAGPLAGLVVAVPLLYLGLRNSVLVPAPPLDAAAYTEPSLLLALMSRAVYGDAPAGVALQLSPVAFAAWIGIFVTGLNLLPVGQLDGGHIAYALVGSRRARLVGMTTVALMVLAGIFLWPGLLTWALVVALMAGFSHLPALDDITPPDTPRALLGVATLLLAPLVLLPASISGR